jgi:exportin-1
VVEDDNGNIVRETMKDNDVLAQYKTMRETLVYLCHLDYEDTENQMLERLRMQVWGRLHFTLFTKNLNCLPSGKLALRLERLCSCVASRTYAHVQSTA